jgi:hypothetical protein
MSPADRAANRSGPPELSSAAFAKKFVSSGGPRPIGETLPSCGHEGFPKGGFIVSTSSSSPNERSLRARLAAYTLHSERDSRELTESARRTFLARFEREVDPGQRRRSRRRRLSARLLPPAARPAVPLPVGVNRASIAMRVVASGGRVQCRLMCHESCPGRPIR